MRILTQEGAAVGRWCGYDRLRDDLHGVWLREMIAGQGDMTLLAHRGSYKTTCAAIALAVLCVIRPASSLMFLRKTEDDAAEILRQVKLVLETDAMRCLSSALYGSPVRVVRAVHGELTCDCYGAMRGVSQLISGGVGESMTGRHAEVIFTDDIVTIRDRFSEAERQHTRQIYMELQNIRSPGGRIVNTATPWHPQDAVSLMPNPMRFDCRSTGLLTPKQLDELRAVMSPTLFAANYELRHIARENAVFTTPPVFFEDEAALFGGIAHVDAAYGGSDMTAFTIARREGDTIYLYGRLWQRAALDVLDEIAALCERFAAAPILCETNGDKGFLGRELQRKGLTVRLYTERQNKAVKISAYLRKWWPHLRFLRETDDEYLAQILDWTETAAHDDAPDSAACVCRRLDGRG